MTEQAVGRISYDDLYVRWEKGNWRASEIDFTQDKADWAERFSDIERRAALWNYAMFFHGEDAVTDDLSPYIDAAPLEEQKYFLTTQQVDEARHSVFFSRFMREVVERGETIGSALDATHAELTWGFRKTFEKLEQVANELRRDRSRPMLARAVCLYHVVIEGTIAQTGQHFIEDYLTERQLLPGFLEGMANISRDEQRHIAFGVKLLSDLDKEDPDCRVAVADLLREVTPYSTALFVPPGWDRRYVELFGKSLEDIYEQATISLEQKLRAAGMPIEELPGPPLLPRHLSSRERSERVIRLLEAGLMGEKAAAPSRDPEVVGLMFDALTGVVDTSQANGGFAIQWDFPDAEPWFMRVENGATTSDRGRLENPDVTLRVRYDDWVDIFASRQDPTRALLTGKLRPKGSIAKLWRLRKLLPR